MLVGLALAGPPETVPRDAPGDVMPKRLWDVTHLDLDVRIDLQAGTIDGVATHTLEPLARPHDRFRLYAVGLAIREIEVDGKVTDELREGREWIDIPIPPTAGPHVVKVAYSGKPRLGLHFRGPAHGDRSLAVWSQGEDEDNRYWFPSWDTPNDTFTVTQHITVPDGLLVRANGTEQGKEPADTGWTRHTWAIEQPIAAYHVALVAGDYRAVSLEGRVPLEIIGPAGFDEARLRAAADDAVAQMAFFEDLLDEPFPYPVYRQAWVERFMYGGMENPGLTTLAVRSLPDPAFPDRIVDSENLIAHELAHQWFGDLVTCYGWRELWLNEGFATYYAHLWGEEKHGPEFAAAALYRRRAAALGVTGPMAPRAHTYDGSDNHGVYVKGASVLHLLRTYLGDATYHAAIRHYLDENRFRLVESEDLRRAFEDVSGEHLGWVFDQWVHGAGIPTWKSSWAHEDGTLTVTVVAGEGPVFHAPVDIEVGTAKGARTHRVWLGEGSTRLVLESPDAPLWVAIDPQGALLGNLDATQTPAAWLAQAERSPSPYARILAMAQLGSHDPTDESIAALDRIANGPLDPEFRNVAVDALGRLAAHPAAQASVVKASADPQVSVRTAAAGAMSNAEGKDTYLPALEARLREETEPEALGTVMASLAHHAPERAVALARKRLARKDDSVTGVEHRFAEGVLADHGTAEDALALLRFLGPEHPRPVRGDAARAVLALWEKEEPGKKRDRLQERAALTLLEWLADPDYRVRSSALRHLGKVGRDADIPAIEAYARLDPVPAHDALSQEAIRAIREPEKPSEDPLESVKKRLDALSDQVDEAAGRLDRLEEWRE